MPSMLESIMLDLRELPPAKLVEVSEFIHQLQPSRESMERKRAALNATAGCMPGQEGDDFERAVRETADQLDQNGH